MSPRRERQAAAHQAQQHAVQRDQTGILERAERAWQRAGAALRSLRGRSADPTIAPGQPYTARIRRPLRSDRPRVLHVIANVWTGGSAKLVVDLFEHLGHAYEQRVLTRDAPPVPAYIGIDVEVRERLRDRRSALRIVRSFAPHLVHVHWLGHRRTGYSRLDWDWYHQVFQALEAYGVGVIENVNIPVEPYVSRAVVRYVYVSRYVLERFGRDGDPNVVIYPGSDLTHFRRRSAPSGECVGMVYRLERDKIGDDAIEVFVQVLRARSATRALIVGGGTLLEPFRRRVRDAGLDGRVEFTGYRPYGDLPALFERMQIAVAPVHAESFGQVTPFAMGMELPVAGFAVGALPEILGREAPLVPPADMNALAGVIVELLRDPERCRRIGRANRERAERLFSLEQMVQGYEALWSEALGGSGHSRAEAGSG